jgi:hypothetical protein
MQPHESRAPRPADYGWIGGVVLIALGCIFMLQNAGVPIMRGNWWAVFILIPVVFCFGAAWTTYRSQGRWTRTAATMLVSGLAPLVVALVFMFDLEWGQVWPAFVIIAGLWLWVASMPHEAEA